MDYFPFQASSAVLVLALTPCRQLLPQSLMWLPLKQLAHVGGKVTPYIPFTSQAQEFGQGKELVLY